MIIEKILNQDFLTDSEKHIVEYVLDRDNNIENLTSSELGKRSFSSQSSVIRLYKKLGMKTYREFISVLLLERNEYFKIKDLSQENPIHYFASFDDAQKTISSLYAQTMINTNFVLNKNTLIRVCNRIMKSKIIDVYSSGISETISKQMIFKLQSLGICCTFHNQINDSYIENANKDNICIFINIEKDNDYVLKMAEILKNNNFYTISLSHITHKDLSYICHDNLFFNTNSYKDIDTMCCSFAAGYVIDLIYSILIYRKQLSSTEIPHL
jgi:Transcriptional regulators